MILVEDLSAKVLAACYFSLRCLIDHHGSGQSHRPLTAIFRARKNRQKKSSLSSGSGCPSRGGLKINFLEGIFPLVSYKF